MARTVIGLSESNEAATVFVDNVNGMCSSIEGWTRKVCGLS